MPPSLSDRVKKLVASDSLEQEVHLHVLIRRDVSGRAKEELLERLAQLAGAGRIEEIMKGSGILSVSTKVQHIPRISAIPEVDWIDLDSTAPDEELCDEKA